MKGKAFIDTNIFVYAFDRSDPAKAKAAVSLVHELSTSGRGVISYQVVQEFFNVALRKFKKPLTAFDAQRYFSAALRPLLSVQSSSELFSTAFSLFERHSLSWYDSLIVAAADVSG